MLFFWIRSWMWSGETIRLNKSEQIKSSINEKAIWRGKVFFYSSFPLTPCWGPFEVVIKVKNEFDSELKRLYLQQYTSGAGNRRTRFRKGQSFRNSLIFSFLSRRTVFISFIRTDWLKLNGHPRSFPNHLTEKEKEKENDKKSKLHLYFFTLYD